MARDGLRVFAKRDCPTCVLVEPVFAELSRAGMAVTIYSQDDPAFPRTVTDVVDDRELAHSYQHAVEIVPTVVRVENGKEVGRVFGWHRGEWETLSGVTNLGASLPESKPGCGSKSFEPGVEERLALRFGGVSFNAREVTLGEAEDDIEACFDRGWSDGLPVVPPTKERVLRMLRGSSRDPDEVLGIVPPALAECTVEKVAVNAVLAGARPEYFPVVLAAVEAILDPRFAMHGVLATTDFASPIVIVSGAVARQIGMNSGVNALGQGNRANATIGRTVQLVVRNIGGGLPGQVDRATIGQPGKYTYCIAEDESDSQWQPFRVDRGFSHEQSTVTLFAGGGVHGLWSEDARTPEELVALKGEWLARVGFTGPGHALMIVTPEHFRIYNEAGWERQRIKRELVKASGGKILQEGLLLIRAGGPAGLQAGVIAGWSVGERGSDPVTREVSL